MLERINGNSEQQHLGTVRKRLYKRLVEDTIPDASYGYSAGGDTCRGITQLAPSFGYTSDEFTTLLTGKKVCDISSGVGGLGIDAHLRGIDTTILSINPRYQIPGYKDFQLRRALAFFGENQYGQKYSQNEILKAIEAFWGNAYSDFAQFLPFPNNYFDVGIDNRGVFNWTEDREELELATREMVRVIKPGGTFLLNSPTTLIYQQGAQATMHEEVLEQIAPSVSVIRWKGYTLGAQIRK